MNFERFEFKELEIESGQIKGVLQCLLHSILFNRALGAFTPKDAECVEMEGLPYAKLDDAGVDSCVDSYIERFVTGLKKSGSSKGNVCLGFYEKKSEKKGFWSFAGPKEEKVYWERWIMPISIAPNAGKNQAGQQQRTTANTDRDAIASSRHARLLDNLLYLVLSINEKRDHIPVKNLPAPLYFSFELSFTFGEKADESWGLATIKKMLKQGPPMLLSS